MAEDDAQGNDICSHPDRLTRRHANAQAGRPFAELDQPVARVNHPPHYGGEENPYEAIKVIDAWGLGFCLGNTVKYICRAKLKGTMLEDLKKAQWYLQHEIDKLQGA